MTLYKSRSGTEACFSSVHELSRTLVVTDCVSYISRLVMRHSWPACRAGANARYTEGADARDSMRN